MPDIWGYSFDHPWFFTNFSFLITLGAFLIIYALLQHHNLVRKIYVILFSLFFYYKSSGFYLLIFIGMIVCDYTIAQQIEKIDNKRSRKLLLALSIVCSLSFLLYFKYSGFFLQIINDLTSHKFTISNIFLPIGISFYTFQSISYIVDVYQGKIKSSKKFLDYLFYMTFFPHLVAGPIVRAKDFIPQINQPLVQNKEIITEGFFRIIIGLCKKLFIADYLAKYIDMVHANPSGYSGFENIISMYSYACQIYFDFSGYSDIAIGIALLLGFRLKENFKNPYRSSNITEFWRRWHISLSSWLKDYIYIPLGGNKGGKYSSYLNIMITMGIGGIWHGASWKFVLWGIAHGFALIVHKIYTSFKVKGLETQDKKSTWWVNCIGVIITFNFVSFLWIFFRAQTFSTALQSINKIIYQFDLRELITFIHARTMLIEMLAISFIIIFTPGKIKEALQKYFTRLPLIVILILISIVLQLILQIKTEEVQQFIYFQF